MRLLKSYFAILILTQIPLHSVGQSSHDTKVSSVKADAYAIERYAKVMEHQSLLYNGREYKEIKGSDDQHPYLESDYPEPGIIFYDRQLYDKIPLLYNLVTDELIIEHNNNQGFDGLIRLNSGLINYFTVYGHTFYRLTGDSTTILKTGFYDFLYDGNLKVIAKKRKSFHEEISGRQVNVKFKAKTNYYLKKGEQYFLVRGKRSALKVLNDQSKALKQYSSINKLRFTGNRERAFVELAMYYDKINQP